jgi:hypothetical protein
MVQPVPDVPFEIGQRVRRRGAPEDAPAGLVAGLVFVEPHEALVRWRDAPATFELVDALVDVEARQLT